jgi:hypothetical protein
VSPAARLAKVEAASYRRSQLRGMAGVAGFEPTYGGIKTRDSYQHDQQVADLAGSLVPSTPFDSPSLPPELPLASAGQPVANKSGANHPLTPNLEPPSQAVADVARRELQRALNFGAVLRNLAWIESASEAPRIREEVQFCAVSGRASDRERTRGTAPLALSLCQLPTV